MNTARALSLAFLASSLLLGASCCLSDDCPSDKFALWTSKSLHGANIIQGRNPNGGPNGIGDGEYAQSDFDQLRQAGANYVQLSHAGTFAETAPYSIDSVVEATLDMNIQRAMTAGLYVVIAFRSGPGRNENTITNRDGTLNEQIWTVTAARTAWVEMLRHTAERYQANPAVVGYSIMVEPNAYARHGFPDPADFYARFAGTLQDVNGLYSLATAAIREVDAITPILLEPEGYGNINWLSYLSLTGDSRTVYTPHDYTPFDYTHEAVKNSTYPGNYDLSGDGNLTLVDKSYLTNFLAAVSQFSQLHSVPVALTEFGVHRTASNAATYLSDRIAIQNEIGSWAVWAWQPANFDDPFSMHDASSVHTVLTTAWASNCTPVFPQPSLSSGMLLGRSLSQQGKAVKAAKILVGASTITSASNGRYAVTLTEGTYAVSATSKGRSCSIGSRRGPKQRSVEIGANTSTRVNVYCGRR